MGTKNERLQSLDALRGFTMFWIIGGGTIIHALAMATGWEVFIGFSNQLRHVEWNGFHFIDLIFPLFMFVSGVAMPYSLGRKLKQGTGRTQLIAKVAKRSVVLIIFGVIYNNKISFDFANMRYASVLGQIGVAYFIAACFFLYTGRRGQILWTAGILLGFWAVMSWVPVPGIGAGVLTPEGNFSGYVDRLLLPGVTYRPDYDPQGVLLMISAATITLMGAMTGSLLINENYAKPRKAVVMALSGAALVGLGLVWNILYPINKEIWSSSFNVLTIGLSLLLLALFYYVIDVKGCSKWSAPLLWIGLNPITIYMAYRMVNFRFTSEFLLNGMMSLCGDYAGVVSSAGVVGLELLLLYYLYKKRIFLKV